MPKERTAFNDLNHLMTHDVLSTELIKAHSLTPGNAPTCDFARFAFQDAANCFERCRFARAIWPKQRDNLPWLNLKGNAAQHENHAAICDFNIIDAQGLHPCQNFRFFHDSHKYIPLSKEF